MNVSLYQAAAALDATSRWQEAISENLASANVPGHKRHEVSFGTIQAGMIQHANGTTHPTTLPTSATSINFRQGELKFTGSKSDLAVEGSGFLGVQLPDGREAYTRDGEFRIDPFGQLITKQGYPVMGNGGTIQIDLNNPTPLSIAASGEVAQGTDVLGRIRLTEFNDPQLLKPVAGGFYLADHPDLVLQDAEATTVRQGYLESSNASSVTQMSQLITALRAYEANQRIIQVQDERTGRLITELGNPG
jgi:flagellar basal-body rod protein FlgG